MRTVRAVGELVGEITLERVDADKCAHARGDVGFNHKLLRSCGLAHAHS